MPWFATLFGRDAIIASFQSLAFRPQIAIETLDVLAAYQATEKDDWRDAEPGKILHELRTGEMAGAGELPHTPYYGSVDSTPLWLILFARDLRLDRRPGVRGPALAERPRGARVDRHATATATATASSSTSGARPAGSSTRAGRTPATRSATGAARSDDADRARRGPGLRLRRQAADRRPGRGPRRATTSRPGSGTRRRSSAERFEDAFWVEDQRYYAMALDGGKRQLDAIGSNAGQCLWSGIASPARARDVADRLMSPAMFSGWGDPDVRRGSARLQPDRLPHGLGLAARHVADRRRA